MHDSYFCSQKPATVHEKELRTTLLKAVREIENISCSLKMCVKYSGNLPVFAGDNHKFLEIAHEKLDTSKMWINKYIHND